MVMWHYKGAPSFTGVFKNSVKFTSVIRFGMWSQMSIFGDDRAGLVVKTCEMKFLCEISSLLEATLSLSWLAWADFGKLSFRSMWSILSLF